MADGRWQMADGGWRMAGGGWRHLLLKVGRFLLEGHPRLTPHEHQRSVAHPQRGSRPRCARCTLHRRCSDGAEYSARGGAGEAGGDHAGTGGGWRMADGGWRVAEET